MIVALKAVDFIDAGGGNNTVTQLFGDAKITAGSGNDWIKTGLGNSRIDAGDGNNTVIALGGQNEIVTGSGNDAVHSGSGDDTIDAGDGNNVISAGSGNNRISTGSGQDQIYTLWDDDVISSGDGDDNIFSGAGNDKIDAGEGCDYVDAGSGDDTVYGGRGSDTLLGGAGDDVLYGDGPVETGPRSFDFINAQNWTNLISADGTTISLDGATLTSTGGKFAPNEGVSILSPSDILPGAPVWTKQIDDFNDTPESVKVTFDTAQSRVSFTLGEFFIEAPIGFELAQVNVSFTDGSTKQVIVRGTATGSLDVTLDNTVTEGRLISSFELAPFSPRRPFSEFNLTSLTFEGEVIPVGQHDDKLLGGLGDDRLDGGWGDDKLFGESGDDVLNGGQGDNLMFGGSGRDTFVFDKRATGDNVVADFQFRHDKLQFDDGVSVASAARDGGDLVLTLNNGGTVTLNHLGHVGDWTHLV